MSYDNEVVPPTDSSVAFGAVYTPSKTATQWSTLSAGRTKALVFILFFIV